LRGEYTYLNNRASGYAVWKNMISPEHEDMSNALGAYGIYSTLEDLYLWDRALYTDQIVSFESREKIFTAYHECYGGYGWHIAEQEINGVSRKRVGHIGDINGFNANFIRYPEDDLVVILLSNVSITPVEQISEDLARITLGEAIPILEDLKVIHLSDEDFNICTGLYRERENESNEIVITHEEGKLFMEMSKRYGIRYKYELVPIHKRDNAIEFITTIVEEKVQLFLNEQGKISYLRYHNMYGKVEDFDKYY
jgi:CubicO group peptidase (beta-lactamase class C family)